MFRGFKKEIYGTHILCWLTACLDFCANEELISLHLPSKHTTWLQRRCNVTTLQRRCNDVDATLCVCWVGSGRVIASHYRIYPIPKIVDPAKTVAAPREHIDCPYTVCYSVNHYLSSFSAIHP